MTDIYEQHSKAFAQVSAYVILKDGRKVATIAIKYGGSRSTRISAYVHWIGLEMVRGHADGGGYDKVSAACRGAAGKLALSEPSDAMLDFTQALLDGDNGAGWDYCLRNAGFEVMQAV